MLVKTKMASLIALSLLGVSSAALASSDFKFDTDHSGYFEITGGHLSPGAWGEGIWSGTTKQVMTPTC